MTALATPAPPKLPVWRVAGVTYAIVRENFGQLMRISWLWLLIVLPVYVVLDWLQWSWADSELEALTLLPRMAVEWSFLASTAVAWHRLILRGERVMTRTYLRLDRIVWRYVAYFVLFEIGTVLAGLLLLLGAGMLLSAAGSSLPPALEAHSQLWARLITALSMAVALLASRTYLILPAVALGEAHSVLWAWRMARANTLRLALAMFVCLMPLGLTCAMLKHWLHSLIIGRMGYVVGELILSVGRGGLLIYAATMLSVTYAFFTAPPSYHLPLDPPSRH